MQNCNSKLKSSGRNGFTLVEMLISISIFMVFIGIISSSFTSLVKANREANNMQKMYKELNFVFDALAQEIRSGKLDYKCITSPDNDCIDNLSVSNTVLGILHESGSRRSLFKFENGKIKLKKQNKISAPNSPIPNSWSLENWKTMTSDDLPVRNFYFTVFPPQDPYSSNSVDNLNVQWQPSVSIYLETENDMEFQTTYSSRTYGEKDLYENQQT